MRSSEVVGPRPSLWSTAVGVGGVVGGVGASLMGSILSVTVTVCVDPCPSVTLTLKVSVFWSGLV